MSAAMQWHRQIKKAAGLTRDIKRQVVLTVLDNAHCVSKTVFTVNEATCQLLGGRHVLRPTSTYTRHYFINIYVTDYPVCNDGILYGIPYYIALLQTCV